jgi:membrane protease YdiL (CAAX protease family)
MIWWHAVAFAVTAGISFVTLVGLYFFVLALRTRWFPLERLRPGEWTGREVFAAFFVGLGLPICILLLLTQMGFFASLIGPPPDQAGPAAERSSYTSRCVAIGSPITLTVTVGTLIALLFFSSGSRPHHFGLTWARWPANLGLGLAAFVVTWPLIMGIQALASICMPSTFDPYAALAKLDLPAWEWLLFGFQLMIHAPILEEILFRGILQGWLRRAALAGHLSIPFVTLYRAAYDFAEYDKATDEYSFQFGPLVFATLLAIGYGFWLYRLTRHFRLSDAEIKDWQVLPIEPSLTGGGQSDEGGRQVREHDDERRRRWAEANATLAIYGTAMLWAIVHSSNWPAPLPLFPMGLALGWLSRRTQSLVGPIVFHAMFNLTSFIALYGTAMWRP